MADQSVRITNMPETSDRARVAFDMVKYMYRLLPASTDSETKIKSILDLYADCYDAAGGGRRTTRN